MAKKKTIETKTTKKNKKKEKDHFAGPFPSIKERRMDSQGVFRVRVPAEDVPV